MTMETIASQQDGNGADSVAESKSARMQTAPGQNAVPTLAQVGRGKAPGHLHRELKMACRFCFLAAHL